MELGGVTVSIWATALHTIKNLSVEVRHYRKMVYFLVSWFCDWICKPGTEQHRREQSMEPRQCRTNQGSVQLQCNECSSNTKITLNRHGLSDKRGLKTFEQGFTVCCETRDGTKNSQGLCYTISTEGACQYGYDFRLKHCASHGGATLSAAGRRAGRTGLNLHFILVILFSTNKLKPEKT